MYTEFDNGKDKNLISVIFNNIDGNASNFDTFVAELGLYENTFSVIAIAETNINEENKNLYGICNYKYNCE